MMNYKSPIELITSQMNLAIEGEICKAVQNVGVIVEKEELLKALKYDRNQYQKGYSDRDDEIVRCKDCKHGYHIVNTVNGNITIYRVFCRKPYIDEGNATHEPDWFCADGERK